MPFLVVRNDIASMDTDIVVNAANRHLAEGGGVCGAIFAGAGARKMREACRKIGGCPVGSSVVTPGFDLSARYVVHAVGPVWHGGGLGEERLLRSAYRSALAWVRKLGCTSISLPLISAGIFGYPPAQALKVATDEIRRYLGEAGNEDISVYLVVFDRRAFAESLTLYGDVRELIDRDYADRVPPRDRLGDLRASGIPDEDFAYQSAAAPAADGAPLDEIERCGDSSTSRNATACTAHAVPAAPAGSVPQRSASLASKARRELERLISHRDTSFSQEVLLLIDARGMTDVEVYKRANLSRQLFAKVRKGDGYRPTKQTAVALALALGLDREETDDLLSRAGYVLGSASRFDIIVGYYIDRGIYDVLAVNEMLFAFDQPLLGSM